jgi:hypothetical protein
MRHARANGSRMLRRTLVAALAIASAATLTGCGRDGDRAKVRTVTERFFAAVQRGDGASACSQLSPDTRSELESQESKPCARAIAGMGLHGAAITRVQVFITNAKADLAGGESAFLDQGPQGWQLSAAGCKPQGGKPADEPYDCEVQD